MLRNIGGVVAGLLAGVVTASLVSMLGNLIVPAPAVPAPDVYNAAALEAMKQAYADFPLFTKLLLAIAWLFGGFVGAFAAGRIVGARWAIWAVAVPFALIVTANAIVLPMPMWVRLLSIAAPLVGAFLAERLGAVGARHVEVHDDAI